MENKYSFQEIDNEIRDSYLRTSRVFDERDKLRDNWNSLREWLERMIQRFIDIDNLDYVTFQVVRDKMNELESGDNNEISSISI